MGSECTLTRGGGVFVLLACAEPLYDGPVSSLWQGQDAPKAIPQAEGEHSHEPLEVTLAIMQYMVRLRPVSLSGRGGFRLWRGRRGLRVLGTCWFAVGRRGC